MKIQNRDFKNEWHIDEFDIKNYEQFLIGSINIAQNFDLKIDCCQQDILNKKINCLYFPFIVDKNEFLKLNIKNKNNRNVLAKFIYLTCKKYYEIIQLYFKIEDFDKKPFKRLNETMYKESCKTIEKIIFEFNEYKKDYILDSLISAYLQFWISIFKEMVQLTLDTFEFEGLYNEMANLTQIIETEETYTNFNTYVEQTIFNLISEKQAEAFNFFGLNQNTSKEEFKKIYRKLSKKYHPDLVNGSEEVMQKINYYKIILDNYFNGEEDE